MKSFILQGFKIWTKDFLIENRRSRKFKREVSVKLDSCLLRSIFRTIKVLHYQYVAPICIVIYA